MRRISLAWIALVAPLLLGAETFAPEPANGPPTVATSYPVDGKPEAAIGRLTVAGDGEVKLFAKRVEGRVFVRAVGPDGAGIGRAESLVGLGDTPIFIRVPQGLYKVVVHWKN